MQEGILSLMQMAKTSAAIMRHDEQAALIIILTNPTTGGNRQLGFLGDVILAEPKALIGLL